MDKQHAWILAANDQTARELAHALGQWMDADVQPVTLADWRDQKLPRGWPQVVLLDLRSPEIWSQLREIRETWKSRKGEQIPFIGLVEHGIPMERVTLAEELLADVIMLPCPVDGWKKRLQEAVARERVRRANKHDEYRVLQGTGLRFTTYSPDMFPLLEQLEVASQSDFTILLIGETGTGKTTLARLIHDLSPRRGHRFTTVPCGSLPNELIDSELFGHVKGAFTGADRDKEGKFSVTGGGTILLDEIDVLGLVQQAKLLRVLETGEYEPVGSNETTTTASRTIVASNICLETLAAKNHFRQDLFFRLNQVRFEIPPLRHRPLDIVPLAIEAIEECCREHNLPPRRIHVDFLETLRLYSWPGNIRELRNEVRRAVLFARDHIVTPAPLSASLLREVEQYHAAKLPRPIPAGLATEVAQTEQDMIESALRSQNFNRAATARALGISRVTLYNKLRKYGITVDEKNSSKLLKSTKRLPR
jgi:DNA-binding NtrC family response regulator